MLGKKAAIERSLSRAEDVPEMHADVTGLEEKIGFRPRTELQNGLEPFVDRSQKFYGDK